MKRKQYFISTRDGKIEVMGYPVVIAGYEEFEFFAHRPDGKGDSAWHISESITGLNVSPHSYPPGWSDSTRAGAFAIVVERFKSMEREKASAILKAAIARAQA